MDDDPQVRKLVVRILHRARYEVVAASGFAEAEERIRDGLQPQLLVTDVVLGSCTGQRVAAMVQSHLPGLPVLYMSGYDNVEVTGSTEPVLRKPFNSQELLEVVARALGEPAAMMPPPLPFELHQQRERPRPPSQP